MIHIEYSHANDNRFRCGFLFVPAGTLDNSPPIHRWVHKPLATSSPDSGDRHPQRCQTPSVRNDGDGLILPSLTGLVGTSDRSPTVETVGYGRVSLTGQGGCFRGKVSPWKIWPVGFSAECREIGIDRRACSVCWRNTDSETLSSRRRGPVGSVLPVTEPTRQAAAVGRPTPDSQAPLAAPSAPPFAHSPSARQSLLRRPACDRRRRTARRPLRHPGPSGCGS